MYWGDTPCDNACPGEMECLTDDSGMTDMYFCSDSCTNDTNCIGGCCYDTGNGSYCAPRDPYCLGLKRVWYWGETSCVTGGGNECPGGMECLVDDSGQPNMYFCSDPCTTDASCVNGCCYDTGVESFCAPRDPYCL